MNIKKEYTKRFFDVIISSISIIFLSPLLTLIAFFIKLEGFIKPSTKGPIIHTEIRISKGKPFKMYKFRTVKGKLLEKVKRDPIRNSQSYIQYEPGALTSVGRFLVKFYLDELPQLFNILKGEMTFVGPRPQEKIYYEKLRSMNHPLKYIKAGLCGLAQACKRNRKLRDILILEEAGKLNINIPKVIYLDKIYFDKYKKYTPFQLLIYDLKIMFRTFLVNVKAQGLKR